MCGDEPLPEASLILGVAAGNGAPLQIYAIIIDSKSAQYENNFGAETCSTHYIRAAFLDPE